MSGIEKILMFFSQTMNTPKEWGTFHLSWLAVMIAIMLLLFIYSNQLSKNQNIVNNLTFGIGCFLLLLELFKQILCSLHFSENGVYWDYPWQIFPFQLCSTPIFVCLLLPFLREGPLHRALCCFLGCYGLLAGFSVMLRAQTVFSQSIFMNIHTMLWHISLVVLGTLQWCGGTFRFYSAGKPALFSHSPKPKDFRNGTCVFAAFLCGAVFLNAALPQFANEGFNMFFVSPYIPCGTAQIFEKFWNIVPYSVYLSSYAFVLIAGAGILYVVISNFNTRFNQTCSNTRFNQTWS